MKKKLTMRNHFVFTAVFSRNPELAGKIISIITGKKIRKIQLIEMEKTIEPSSENRGTRLDVWLKDEDNNTYALELQLQKEHFLIHRIKVYHSELTVNSIFKGDEFDTVGDSNVIFLFPLFDPIGEKKTVYIIEENRNFGKARFSSMTNSYIVNFSRDRAPTNDKDIEEIAEYFYNDCVSGDISKELDDAVNEVNEMTEWGSDMRTIEEELYSRYINGRYEGIIKGKKEGRKKAKKKEKKRAEKK